MRARPTIAIVGGGITGLAAAYALRDAPADVVVLEAAARLGGKIAGEKVGDVEVEAGPDSFLARTPAAVNICNELGLGGELVPPAVFGAYIWLGGRLRKMPGGFPYGIPVRPARALAAGLLSPAGTARALADFVLPGPLSGGDVSIGKFVRRRFGEQVLDRIVDPLLAGTRAGRADDMSFAAAAPAIDALARSHRSVIAGLRKAQDAGEMEAGPPPFLSLRGGMTQLVDRLARALEGRARVRTATTVISLKRRGERYEFAFHGGTLEADAVVLAIPSWEAARLVRDVSPDAAGDLAEIAYAPVAVATFLWPPGALSFPPGGSGFLVPSSEKKVLAACTWYSTKWPHAAPPDGRQIVRCFVGRAAGDPALEIDDGRLVDVVLEELMHAMGQRAHPIASHVSRWNRALPQYAVGHLDRVARIETALAARDRLYVAGAAYRGSGLPDCIDQGTAAGRRAAAAVATVRSLK